MKSILLLSFFIISNKAFCISNESGELRGFENCISHAVKTKKIISLSAIYLNVAYSKIPADYHFTFQGSFMLNTGWGGSMGQKSFWAGNKNLPLDYKPESYFIFYGSIPSDHISTIYFTVNKSFLTKSKLYRFGIETGPSIVYYSEAFFTKKSNPNSSWLGRDSNYDHYYKEYNSLGFFSKIKLELPICRYIGMQCSAFTDLNPHYNLYGVEMGITLGLCRDKLPNNPLKRKVVSSKKSS